MPPLLENLHATSIRSAHETNNLFLQNLPAFVGWVDFIAGWGLIDYRLRVACVHMICSSSFVILCNFCPTASSVVKLLNTSKGASIEKKMTEIRPIVFCGGAVRG